MRTDQEMYQIVLEFAKNDERIMIICMEGSRTNINVPKGGFQNYDML